ncbi:hypothetical protein F0Z19_2659 [Vibrio cyclitrophicus]|nr:hypothetical protein F0Z19_2659 [Vibrio cyclitrophicus]
MPVVSCAIISSAPKKVLPLGRQSKGGDELNLREELEGKGLPDQPERA